MTPYLLFEVAFIPTVFGLVKANLDRVRENKLLVKQSSNATLFFGVLSLAIGLCICYWGMPEVLKSGEAVIRTRGFVMSSSRSQEPFGYWLSVLAFYGSSVLCAWMGATIVWLYMQDRVGISYWKKIGGALAIRERMVGSFFSCQWYIRGKTIPYICY